MRGYYSLRDCDCRYCLYYDGQQGRVIRCLAETCVCQAEIDEALARAGPGARFRPGWTIQHRPKPDPAAIEWTGSETGGKETWK